MTLAVAAWTWAPPASAQPSAITQAANLPPHAEVRTGDTGAAWGHGARSAIAGAIVDNGLLVWDPETIRRAARRMRSLRQNNWQANSGLPAPIAGEAIGADTHLASMATEKFLSRLPETEMERVASANAVLPRQTGKATRAAFIEEFKEERFVYDRSRFTLNDDELREYAAELKNPPALSIP